MIKLLMFDTIFKSLKTKTAQYIILGIIIIIIAYFGKKAIDNFRAGSKAGTIEGQLVARYYAALHSGLFGCCEDLKALNQLATETGELFQKVNRLYNTKHGVYLDAELTRLLNETELNKFYNNLENTI